MLKTIRNRINIKAEVDSSMLDTVSYNFLTGVLTLKFQDTAIYQYNDVPWKIAKLLFKAHRNNLSVGSVFHAVIRDRYDYARLVPVVLSA